MTIYMGRVPELAIAMLACAKVGAVHSVVYGGFSVEALASRIEDSQSRLLITCDGGFMNGKVVELKKIADEALKRCATVEQMIVVKRTGHDVSLEAGRDFWYQDLMGLPVARSPPATAAAKPNRWTPKTRSICFIPPAPPAGPRPSSTPTAVTWSALPPPSSMVFDVKEEDRYWCTADPGWVTGHSYIVYGPLLLGATSFMYEGAPAYPYPDRWWSMIERHGINILYTAPTAIRGLMRFGDAWPNRHDLSSLRLLGSVGEPINPEAWRWYYQYHRQRPLPDHGYLVAD